MAAASYDEALRRLLIHEGGYANHPSDPGGPTKFGITIADYRRYVKPGADAADVRAMTVGEAKTIYRERYWNAMRCDDLPAGLDYTAFDYAVHSGVGRSGKVLRRVLGLPDNTHAVTAEVIAAMRSRSAAELIAAMCDERLAFLKRLKTWPVFGAGWGRRVAEVRSGALAIAKAKPAAAKDGSRTKGKGAVPANESVSRGTAGGIAAGGAIAAQQAHQGGARPLAVVAIAALAVALALAGWWWLRRRRKRQQEN